MWAHSRRTSTWSATFLLLWLDIFYGCVAKVLLLLWFPVFLSWTSTGLDLLVIMVLPGMP